MNHRKSYRKLNRNSSHRRALLRNLATGLILHNRIETTLPKAKELKRVADKLVTLGKKNTLNARRQAMGFLMPVSRHEMGNKQKETAVHKLFTEIAPMFSERSGGYTRVIRGRKDPRGKRLDGRRAGDNAEMAVIEFVEGGTVISKPSKRTRRIAKLDTTSGEAASDASIGSVSGVDAVNETA
ncbi:MAG: 50S ribosomal protein L17 [Deltaproteobacteria bacterium]|nr:50S ribosomal protein L17 [Deltaproteobacteria bacterium]